MSGLGADQFEALVLAARASGDAAGYRAALALRPGHKAASLPLAELLLARGDAAGAAMVLAPMLQQHPDSIRGWALMGAACMALGNLAGAEAAYGQVLRFKPDEAVAFNGLGAIRQAQDRADEAIGFYRQALAVRPAAPEILKNLAFALANAGLLEEAEARFTELEGIAPDFAEARMDHGIFRLSLGDYARGWDLYEARWASGVYSETDAGQGLPRWNGEALNGRRLLLWGEQGIGDQILHATMLRDAIRLANGTVTIAVTDRLVPLLARSLADTGAQVVVRGQAVAADLQCPFASLGGLVRRQAGNFNDGIYLRPDPAQVAAFCARHAGMAGGRKLYGLSWRSGNPQLGDAKSIPLTQLAPLFAIPDIAWLSVQYGDVGAEIAASGLPLQIESVDGLSDIDAQAAQFAALDGMVSVSNTGVHLAASIGLRCHVLLPRGRGRFWYWPRPGRSCDWYAAPRFWYQQQDGDWSGSIAALARELSND
ncbi:tetratricopeptide repeat protein [Ferrovibrio sp.]|uniref:tetratricopeptide repeat protein n=1 Tax=Ferrovibrio sp. TaxID=1917215 RepID=UPI0025B842A0|nr:tetratricopeptide repeat protein [Ferrovibrio sp.]MBX3454127.1 tetratricopeptide repeat protein [Ferrovibrio sp.]